MDRSLFLARLMGPTFVAIALGMLINLGMYESMIAEALHTGILFYLSGLVSLLAGLAIVNLHTIRGARTGASARRQLSAEWSH